MKLCGWTIERKGQAWTATLDEYPTVSARLEARELKVHDDEQYYPSGDYSIPLAVIEALQSRGPR